MPARVAQIEDDGEQDMLVTHENETIGQIAKELGNGCTADGLVQLNTSNPDFAGLIAEKKKKEEEGKTFKAGPQRFRDGCEVWLPARASCAYRLWA